MKITPRDSQVLDLLIQGADNKEIGAELNISPRTVKQHLRTLFLRAGIRDGSKRTRLAMMYRAIKGVTIPSGLTRSNNLTAREEEAFRLVVTGRSNKQAADELSVTLQVFKNHLRVIFDKMGVWNRTELAMKSTEAVYVA